MLSRTLLNSTFPRRKSGSLRNRCLQLGCLVLLGIGLCSVTQNASAQYLGRNIVVSQIGSGSGTLSSAGTAVFLDTYTPGGTLQNTLALPTVNSGSNFGLVSSGTATSEGALTLSGDGQYLVYAGYNAAVGTTGVASSTVARVIARVDSSGNVNSSTALTDAFIGNNVRSVTTMDGNTFYVGGTAGSGETASGGVRITTLGSTTSTQLSTTVTNIRNVTIAFGQLYASSASGSNIGVNSVGVGLPTAPGNTITLLPGFSAVSGLSPYSYVVASPTVIYVADDGSTLAANRGLQKWVLNTNTNTWSEAYDITAGLPGTDGLRGLTASIDNGVATLYGTTTETSANDIVEITDPLSATSDSNSFTVVATAPTNTVFRGVAFAPQALSSPTATPEPGGPIAALIAGGLIAALKRRKTKRK